MDDVLRSSTTQLHYLGRRFCAMFAAQPSLLKSRVHVNFEVETQEVVL